MFIIINPQTTSYLFPDDSCPQIKTIDNVNTYLKSYGEGSSMFVVDTTVMHEYIVYIKIGENEVLWHDIGKTLKTFDTCSNCNIIFDGRIKSGLCMCCMTGNKIIE